MSRRTSILALIFAVAVIAVAVFAFGIFGPPAVTDVENRFAGVNETTTAIATNISVQNPNPIGLKLGGLTINYTVAINEVEMANGTKHGLNVSKGNSTLHFRTTMANEQIPPWWISHIRGDEQSTLNVHATITSSLVGQRTSFSPVTRSIDTDILSAFNSSDTRPINANQPLVSDPVLYLNETAASWGSVTRQATPIDMEFLVYNPKPVPYTITEIGYTITMNNITVGEGASEREYVIPPHDTETIETTTAIQNQALDEWWVSHLTRNQRTQLRIEFYARLELPSGQTIQLPLDALTYTETIETDIFGTKPESGRSMSPTPTSEPTPTPASPPTPAGTPTPTPTETRTPTESGLLDTETPTPAPSPTTEPSTPTVTQSPTGTPTPTQTDDGGLPLALESHIVP